MADASQPQPIIGVLPAGQPLITQPTSQPSPTSFLYAVPARGGGSSRGPEHSHFSHVAVFLLPGVALPDGTAAAIYLALNPAALASGAEAPNFKFLGGIGPGKESAVFKLNAGSLPSAPAPPGAAGGPGQQDLVVFGVNIEDAAGVAERIRQQKAASAASGTTSSSSTSSSSLSGSAPGGGGGVGSGQTPSTQVLAQRIIQNAYNFLSSFSGQAGGPGGVEVVPLKAFQDWWNKFEGRVRSDPTFLERPQD